MVSLSSQAEVVGAIGRARRVLLTAYTLPDGAVRKALENAAERGAKVTVRLNGFPYRDDNGNIMRDNDSAVARLREGGADAQLVHTSETDGPVLHMKSLVCDGTAYLDDRNWPDDGMDTIVRDDFANDVRAIEDAAAMHPDPAAPYFATTKNAATRMEARLLYGAMRARTVDVESESFGSSPQAFGALSKLARAGVRCRLLVSQRDVTAKSLVALKTLAKRGVRIREGDLDEKIAVVDGKRAWTGSANATSNAKTTGQIDWGLRTDKPEIVDGLQRHFERNWRSATPFAA